MAILGALSVLAVGVSAGAMVTGCGGPGTPALDRSFARSVEGITVEYPDTWRLTTRNDNYVPDPALCFDLVPRADPSVDLRVVEYLPPYLNRRDLSGYQPRPKHFLLTSLRKGDNDWSPGKITSFRVGQRVFFVGVVMPATADPTIQHSAEQIVGSLRIAAHGRCRPTSGVGSHGVPSPFAKPRKALVPASAALLAKCSSTAKAVGYPVPCPMRVPAGLTPSVGRPGCKLDIIGPAKPCPNTTFAWRGWVVGSSTTANQHLVLTASPRPIQNLAKVVNGPAWLPGERVNVLGAIKMNGWDIHEVYAPPATNEGSAYAHHVVLIWTVGQHTYAVGFHDDSTIRRTLAHDLSLARTIKLVRP